MVKSSFSHVRAWVFDLDHTLYPPKVALFDQIEVLMTDYVSGILNVDRQEASRLRDHYWRSYGTTLAGLMAEHNIEPDPFLIAVHDIDFSVLPPAPDLAAAIRALPGRKIVYTNGTAPYARNVLKARALDGVFDAVYGVEHANYRPKPEQAAFEAVFTWTSCRLKRVRCLRTTFATFKRPMPWACAQFTLPRRRIITTIFTTTRMI